MSSDVGVDRLAAALSRMAQDLAAERRRSARLQRENDELRAQLSRALGDPALDSPVSDDVAKRSEP